MVLHSKDLNARYFGTSRYYYRYGYGSSKEEHEKKPRIQEFLDDVRRFFRKDD